MSFKKKGVTPTHVVTPAPVKIKQDDVKKDVSFSSHVDDVGYFTVKLVNNSKDNITLIKQSVENKKSHINKDFANHAGSYNIVLSPNSSHTLLMIWPKATTKDMLDDYETYTVTYTVSGKEIYEKIPLKTYSEMKKAFV